VEDAKGPVLRVTAGFGGQSQSPLIRVRV